MKIFAPYKARKLTEANVPDILDLYLENTEYFMNCGENRFTTGGFI